MALDGVAGVIAEHTDAVIQQGKGVLIGGGLLQHAGAALPRFAVHQDAFTARQLIQRGAQQIHRFHVVNFHQVEAETVQVVFLRPVEDRVDEIPPGHGALAGKLVAAAAAVRIAAVLVFPEKVSRHDVVQNVLVAVGVVVDHIHDDADAGLVQGLDHGAALPDADFAVVGVGGIAALRDVEVDGVIAPVVLFRQRFCFVHTAEIVHRHDLDIAHTQLLQVVQAGGVGAVPAQGGAGLGEGQKLPAPVRADTAGGILREIADAHLPDHPFLGRDVRPPVVLPPGGRGGIQVQDHAAQAVHTRCHGIGVAGLLRFAVDLHRVGVVAAVLVAGQGDAPHALRIPLHGVHLGAAAAIPVGIKIDRHGLGKRRPEPEGGRLRGVGSAKGAGAGGLAGKGLAFIALHPFYRDLMLHHFVPFW